MTATPPVRALENRSLLAGNSGKVVKSFQMRRRDCGDQRDVGRGQARQRPDLAGMVHTDLDHRKICIDRHPRQCQRHAPVVVVTLFGSVDFRPARKCRRSISLVDVLPTDPVTPMTFAAVRARAAARQRFETRLNVSHHQQRCVLRDPPPDDATPMPPQPLCQGIGDKIMAVAKVAQGHKQSARSN